MPNTQCAAILIAGPTASGKSALALDLARQRGGMIINADSMQVYRELRVLTARPSGQDERQAPHRLYGHVPSGHAYSVSRWLADVEVALEEARALGLCPIVVGGTGLYFKALTEGLSPVPPVPEEVREHWRAQARLGADRLHEILRARDPVMAARLSAGDAQRVTRALEVIDATGVSLAEWQSRPGRPLVEIGRCEKLLLVRARADLHRRCDQRFDEMITMGALDEVRALMRLDLPADRPAMRALGVSPLAAHLGGHLKRDEAIARAKAETRQYVKRQQTWFRKFMAAWRVVAPD